MQTFRLVLLACLPVLLGGMSLAQRLTLTLSAADARPVVLRQIGHLAGGGRQVFRLRLARAESLELRVPFAEAPFNGTQLHARINGRRLAPYFAFGGDTRYDAVQGTPGLRPPLATIEGRWVLPAAWVRAGENELVLWTTGVQRSDVLQRLGPKPALRIASSLMLLR